MKGKVITIGSSVGVTIPKIFRDELSLKAGTPVSIDMEDGAIVIRNIEAKPTEAELTESLKNVISILQKRDRTDTSKEGLKSLQEELLEALSGVIDTGEDSSEIKEDGRK